MSHQLNSLIRMANQIAANNNHKGDQDEVAAIVANHLKKFWARPMKQQIIAYCQEHSNDSELSAIATLAVKQL